METIKEIILSKAKFFNDKIIKNTAELNPFYEYHFIFILQLKYFNL